MKSCGGINTALTQEYQEYHGKCSVPSGSCAALFQWLGGEGMLCWLRLRAEPAGDTPWRFGRAGFGGGTEISSSTEPLEPDEEGQSK